MKRFSDTARFSDVWYYGLPPAFKLAWEYVQAQCDPAGVWSPNFHLADTQIGLKVKWMEFFLAAEGRILVIAAGKWWVKDFVLFQYGKLSRGAGVHRSVIRVLESHGIEVSPDGICIPSESHTNGYKEEVKEEGKDSVEGSPEGNHTPNGMEDPAFDEFWQAYPRRVAKGDAREAWKKLRCAKLLPQILVAIRTCKISADWTKEAGKYVPYPASWLNSEGWNDERQAAIGTPQANGLDKSRTVRLLPHEMPEIITP